MYGKYLYWCDTRPPHSQGSETWEWIHNIASTTQKTDSKLSLITWNPIWKEFLTATMPMHTYMNQLNSFSPVCPHTHLFHRQPYFLYPSLFVFISMPYAMLLLLSGTVYSFLLINPLSCPLRVKHGMPKRLCLQPDLILPSSPNSCKPCVQS